MGGMADQVTVPSAPPLATIPNIELVQAGQWDLSTGRVTFTTGDLASAVAAVDCPSVRRPVLKLGHTDPRFDGQPAVGFIANMATTDGGNTIVGDYTGMPGWLGDVMASAYPDRSIEGCFDYRCQLGHTHPFVITAVALLGVMAPGVGTLESLQDVGALYGVTAGANTSGHAVAVTIHATSKGENPMPNPRPLQIAAAVSSEDVRRQYYDGAPWSVWITEMQLEPMQLIVCDDDTGQYGRIPITLDGDTITFGAMVPVQIQYVDRPQADDGAEPVAAARLTYASRAESRPGDPPRAATPPPAPPAEPVEESTTIQGDDPMALDQSLRERLGLPADADEATILAALESALTPPTPEPVPEPVAEVEPAPAPVPVPEPVAARTMPAGTVLVDEATLADLRRQAAEGVAARAQQLTEARDRSISAAIAEGRIPPARREHWAALWQADPEGTETTLASLAAGTIPLADLGTTAGDDVTAQEAEYAKFDALFSRPAGKDA